VPEPSVVILDACVLYPFHLRNILVQAAIDGLYVARWTDRIHQEWIRNLAANAPSIPLGRLEATSALMNLALPHATISDYEDHIQKVVIPDPDDRHVVAAGIAAAATVIVTWNLRDFPATALRPFGLRAETPDAFLSELHAKSPDLVIGSLANARRNLRKSKIRVLRDCATPRTHRIGRAPVPALTTPAFQTSVLH
jgi:predicted nucleic acid-binding protein